MRVGIKSLLLAGGLIIAAACTDGTNPNGGGPRPADSLTILTLAQGHPPLTTQSISFWAKFDQDTEAEIGFQVTPTETESYLRLRVDKLSLFKYPDGTLFGPGDSVLITINVIDQDSLYFEFLPSGLRFSPVRPAELRIEYNHAGETIEGDFNGDGLVNGADDQIETELDLWVQETPGGVFTGLDAILEFEFDEVEADIFGFSRFALAY
jgi:hypothetical protein